MGILDPIAFHDSTVLTSRWLSVPRPKAIKIITIHATRGGSVEYRTEYLGTITWSKSLNNNQGGWGSSEQRVVQGRDVAIIVPDARQATYGAGYAGAGSVFAVDEYSLNLELAQMRRDTPFEPLTLDTAARQCAAWCIQYGIPVARIPYLAQNTPLTVSGFVGHEDTGNGRILGKSDPGPMFPWNSFLSLVKGYILEARPAPTPTPVPVPTPTPPKEYHMPSTEYNDLLARIKAMDARLTTHISPPAPAPKPPAPAPAPTVSYVVVKSGDVAGKWFASEAALLKLNPNFPTAAYTSTGAVKQHFSPPRHWGTVITGERLRIK